MTFDSFGDVDRLADAVRDSRLRAPALSDHAEGCLVLAMALGRCRLFGIEIPEDLDGDLPLDVARAAAEALLVEITDATAEVDRLESEWSSLVDLAEADALVAETVLRRVEIWAVLIALTDAYFTAIDAGDDVSELQRGLEAAVDGIDRLDNSLAARHDMLETIADLPLFANVRGRLAAEFASCPPWWLLLDQGVIEADARVRLLEAKWPGERLDKFPAPPVLSIAAAAPFVAPPEAPWRWRHPAGGGHAWLVFARVDDGDLRIAVRGPAGERATFAGATVAAGGSFARVDDAGWAAFSWTGLHERRQLLASLFIDGVAWPLETDE